MQTGWIELENGHLYYAGKGGVLVRRDWVKADDGWHYLKYSGLMARNGKLFTMPFSEM